MSDMLPPLPDEAFDGLKEEAEIIAKLCKHINATILPKQRLVRCECGAAWSGFGIEKLYEAMKAQA